MENKISVWAVSLGCPKNRVDTEHFLGSLGLKIIPAEKISKSDVIFINTCAFIEPATRESIRAILESIKGIKRLRRKPLLAVAGCMVGRYGQDELARELPEVDLWLPTEKARYWPEMLRAALSVPGETAPGRLRQPGQPYAWLKISEGCDHHCSFCTIPAIRGPLRSESRESLLEEATNLVNSGVKELDLVAQDVASWGRDISGTDANLESLLWSLAALPDLMWLRLLYLYPARITKELLATMKEIGAPLLPYFDIPFQHCEPRILRKMGRPFNIAPLRTVELIRSHFPDAALRATLIVGFPGETEQDFRKLCKFVEDAQFQHLGVFPFYPEEGAVASSLPGQVEDAVKQERVGRVMELQAAISRRLLARCVGRNMDVLVGDARESEWPGLFAGRVWFQAPEVDGFTYVSGPNVRTGACVSCEIVDSADYDLSALENIPG